MRTGRRAVATFWREHWDEEFDGGAFVPPKVEGLYDSRRPGDGPTCGGDPPPKDNAFYCRPDRYVAWDANLMRRGTELGDGWVYLVIAHEYGHAVQAQIDEEYVPATRELQADCLAAAALYGADADDTFTFEEGDLDEVVDAYQELADKTAWTEVGDHGDAAERISWFQRGKQDGAAGCFEDL